MTNWSGVYDMMAGHPGGTRDELLAGGKYFHALKGVSMLSPQVIADAAVWLASDGAAVVTGVATERASPPAVDAKVAAPAPRAAARR